MSKVTEKRRRVVALGAIAAGVALAVLPMVRADAVTTTTRISGPDRYATAAAISSASFDPGVAVAYLATGTDFPDALAGAPAAAKGAGPVLLTQTNTLPDSTKAELDRLNPAKIIVLGGTQAVSDAVYNQLSTYSASVSRTFGANRWETAADISAGTFAAGVNTVFVATGANFPDALSGGPAVANTGGGGPILLVEHNSIPDATKTELQRLGAQKIVVLGGTDAVSDTVVTALDPYSVDPVVRRFGNDRYLTSVEISKAAFASASTVYLATGLNFPDALAGGSPAALDHGPVLLVQGTCIPKAVNDEITRLDPSTIIVLGGESAVSNAVLSRTECQPGQGSTTLPTFPGGGSSIPGGFCGPGVTLPNGTPVPCPGG